MIRPKRLDLGSMKAYFGRYTSDICKRKRLISRLSPTLYNPTTLGSFLQIPPSRNVQAPFVKKLGLYELSTPKMCTYTVLVSTVFFRITIKLACPKKIARKRSWRPRSRKAFGSTTSLRKGWLRLLVLMGTLSHSVWG
jgi:hypothetical protein